MLLLRLGDEGRPVAAVQRALGVAASGVFDLATDVAVRDFQQLRGLDTDGIVGARTIEALGLDWVTIHPAGFRAEVVRLARQEWRRWHPNGAAVAETDPSMTGVLQGYYRTGVGRTVAAADLQSATWQREHPWSAVFISWLMRTAGAGRRFTYASAHQRYIAAGKRSRLAADAINPFWTFAIVELPVEAGDLVCAARRNSGATYDNIDDGPRLAHSDVVVAVNGDEIRTVGGNVGQTVGAKTLRTSGGRLDLDVDGQHEFFAIVRVQDFG